MKFKLGNTLFSVSYPAVAFCALALISAKDNKMLLCLMSAFLHECGHLVALKKCRVNIKSISLNLGDISINTDETPCSLAAEIFVNLSGVASNFFLAFISGAVWLLSRLDLFRDFSVANLCIGLFNALPLGSLDGGNLLKIFLEKRFSLLTAERIISVLTAVFLLPLFVFGLLILFASDNNFSLLFAALYLLYIFVSKEIG